MAYSLIIALIVVTSLGLALGHSYYECEPCKGEECNVVPKGCLYGITRDNCGRLKCMAGPGKRCGGRENHLGKCGEGLNCICGKCRGCSIDRLFAGIIECDYTNPICD